MTTIMEKCSSAIRGIIIAPEGKKLVIADLSNIEGRVLAWLANEQWKLKAFYDFDRGIGEDLYKLTYAKAFRIKPADVTKDMRQIGKVKELAFGYQGGLGAWITFATAFQIDLEKMAVEAYDSIPFDILNESESFRVWYKKQGKGQYGLSNNAFVVCDSFKRMWRKEHPNTVNFWNEIEDSCKLAVEHKETKYSAGMHKILCIGSWLRISLPSGRCLCYPSPQIIDNKLSYNGIDQYTRKWTRISTYGGKLAENITQAVARDILAYSMLGIEKAGYEIVLTVHDEIIAEAPDSPKYNAEALSKLMSTNPKWASGLPLDAKGFESYRYGKPD